MNHRRHRGLRALLAAAVLLVACSGDDATTETGGGDPSSTSTEAGPVDGGVPDTTPSGDTVPPAGGQATTTTGAGSETTAAPATTAAPQATTTTAAPAPTPAGVGSFAPFYLRPAESSAVTIEAFEQDGAGPSDATLEHVRRNLASVSGKPVSVRRGRIDGGARSWSGDSLRALADSIGQPQQRSEAVLRLYFVRGDFEGDDSVLGIAVRGDLAAVFSDRVDAAAGILSSDTIERAVSLHEAGHLLGLVDLFLDTGREDPEHPGHSRNDGSVMFWAVESSLVGSILGGGPPTEFDQADLDDLAAIRNG